MLFRNKAPTSKSIMTGDDKTTIETGAWPELGVDNIHNGNAFSRFSIDFTSWNNDIAYVLKRFSSN